MTSRRGRRAKTPVEVKNFAVKLEPEQHEALMLKAREMGYSGASMIARAILDYWDLGPDKLNRKLPPGRHEPGFVQLAPGHKIKYEEHGDIAHVLNRADNCACAFCGQTMELVDIRKRYDRWEDDAVEPWTYVCYELVYECGNGDCSTGMRNILEVPAK